MTANPPMCYKCHKPMSLTYENVAYCFECQIGAVYHEEPTNPIRERLQPLFNRIVGVSRATQKFSNLFQSAGQHLRTEAEKYNVYQSSHPAKDVTASVREQSRGINEVAARVLPNFSEILAGTRGPPSEKPEKRKERK